MPRAQRTPSKAHDTSTPAYRVVHGVFGGPAKLGRLTGIPLTTAQDWMVNGHVPGKRMAHLRACAELHGLKLDPALFVPDPALDPSIKLPA